FFGNETLVFHRKCHFYTSFPQFVQNLFIDLQNPAFVGFCAIMGIEKRFQKEYPMQELGQTGLQVSRIALGCMRMVALSDQEASRVLETSLEE
ncbi:hypothetical protein, partial [Escherichia coli]|uniref:hypothetical protein n=1 Tax=Escherichia coli TaxID=562 RepID=UPI00195DB27F